MRVVAEVLRTITEGLVSGHFTHLKVIVANIFEASVASGAEGLGMQDRSYSQQHRFFGENRVTPKGTPRGTPSASRRPSAANIRA